MQAIETKQESSKETSRIEAFSDGVFAIAITLLILEVRIPAVKENESLLKALSHEWTSFLALLIGFFTILICWVNHHYMFKMIHRNDSLFLFINGFKLLVVTITPLATAVLSKYIQTAHEAEAVNIYCLNFAFMGMAMCAIWSYAWAKGFVKAASEKVLLATTRLYIFAATISTLIWLVSFFSIAACLVLSAMMFCVFLFPDKAVKWQVKKMKV